MSASTPIPRVKLPESRIAGWRGLILAFSINPIGFLSRLQREFGEIVLVGGGDYSCLFTFSPEYTHQVLSDPSKFYSFELESIPFPFSKSESITRLTTALALMNGEQHKRQRRLLLPAFHHKRLQGYHEQIIQLTQNALLGWEIGQRRDIFYEMDMLSALISLSILIGMESKADGAKFAILFERAMKNLFNPSAFLLPYEIPGLPYYHLLRDARILEQELEALILERKRMDVDTGDAMSLLIGSQDEDGLGLTDDELIGQTVALFRGGSKTTASALTWILFFLDQHPVSMDRVLEENERILNGAPPSFNDLERLTYLDAVIKESLRLFPPVMWGIRYSAKPFEIAGEEFPAGQRVMYSAQIAHRNPAIFPDPGRFIPERWETTDPSPYEYFPFSAGPRLCLGANFAMMAIKIVLSIMFQRFRPRLIANQKIDRVGLIGSLPRRGLQIDLGAPECSRPRTVIRGDVLRLFEF
ncbi:MAG: cytochrome P450 [Chloroflexi bacterium]|nr:cytochrome P450 [Chloroflexota bacterium]